MSFINPFLLLGVLAAGIPLIIHLWSKRQARVVDFSHVHFLLALRRRKLRRLRIKEILILVLRMLIIALLAIALARPILSARWTLAAGTRAKSSAVIVLDNSYSMGYETFSGVLFDQAKKSALQILETLNRDDDASLILMSDIPDVIFRQLTTNIQQVRSAVKSAQLSYRNTNVQASMNAALALLQESDNPYKAIYLISDLAENGWRNWVGIPEESTDIHIFVVKTGAEGTSNRAIRKIRFSNEPVGMGLPVKISADLIGPGLEPNKLKGNSVVAELFVDGKKAGQKVVDGNVVSLRHVFDHPGVHLGHIALTSDNLALDDTRYFALDVLGQINILLVGSRTFFVELALNPVTSINPEAESLILPATVRTDELAGRSLEQYPVVIRFDQML